MCQLNYTFIQCVCVRSLRQALIVAENAANLVSNIVLITCIRNQFSFMRELVTFRCHLCFLTKPFGPANCIAQKQ